MAGKSGRGTTRQVSRRSALGWIAAAAPAAAILQAHAAETASGTKDAKNEPPPEAPPKPTDLGRFIAKSETGLSSAERKQLLKQLPGLEGALKKLREFQVADGVEPAFTFRALRARKGGRT